MSGCLLASSALGFDQTLKRSQHDQPTPRTSVSLPLPQCAFVPPERPPLESGHAGIEQQSQDSSATTPLRLETPCPSLSHSSLAVLTRSCRQSAAILRGVEARRLKQAHARSAHHPRLQHPNSSEQREKRVRAVDATKRTRSSTPETLQSSALLRRRCHGRPAQSRTLVSAQ
jgi:hypothetical protein